MATSVALHQAFLQVCKHTAIYIYLYLLMAPIIGLHFESLFALPMQSRREYVRIWAGHADQNHELHDAKPEDSSVNILNLLAASAQSS